MKNTTDAIKETIPQNILFSGLNNVVDDVKHTIAVTNQTNAPQKKLLPLFNISIISPPFNLKIY